MTRRPMNCTRAVIRNLHLDAARVLVKGEGVTQVCFFIADPGLYINTGVENALIAFADLRDTYRISECVINVVERENETHTHLFFTL